MANSVCVSESHLTRDTLALRRHTFLESRWPWDLKSDLHLMLEHPALGIKKSNFKINWRNEWFLKVNLYWV